MNNFVIPSHPLIEKAKSYNKMSMIHPQQQR